MLRSRAATFYILALVATFCFMISILIVYSSSWTKSGTKILRLENNNESYYATDSPSTTEANSGSPKKRRVFLFIGIHSAPKRLDRRTAIRETWLPECRNNSKAVCRFFTDGQDADGNILKGEQRVKLENENGVHGDLIFAEVRGGLNFAIKYLWMLEWASKTYDIQYFLRTDDDYFICFRRLLLELEIRRPKGNFQWGWLHCWKKDATWLDEGFFLVSRDVVNSFLSRRETLQCHVWESQAIGYWLKNVSDLTTFGDNKRLIHHQAGFTSESEVAKRKEICHTFVGIHQSYPKKMRLFWSVYQREERQVVYKVPPISYKCQYPIAMDIMAFRDDKFWFAELKPCKDNPTWNRGNEYKGREGA